MVSLETKPGTLKEHNVRLLTQKLRELVRDGANLHFRAFENERLDSDYRVTILSRT